MLILTGYVLLFIVLFKWRIDLLSESTVTLNLAPKAAFVPGWKSKYCPIFNTPSSLMNATFLKYGTLPRFSTAENKVKFKSLSQYKNNIVN